MLSDIGSSSIQMMRQWSLELHVCLFVMQRMSRSWLGYCLVMLSDIGSSSIQMIRQWSLVFLLCSICRVLGQDIVWSCYLICLLIYSNDAAMAS